MKKLKKIPKFKTEAEESAFWSVHDSAEFVDYTKADIGFFPEIKPSSRTISIRLPESLVEGVKLIANKRDVPYQSMLKILLAEKVKEALGLKVK